MANTIARAFVWCNLGWCTDYTKVFLTGLVGYNDLLDNFEDIVNLMKMVIFFRFGHIWQIIVWTPPLFIVGMKFLRSHEEGIKTIL